VAKLTFSLNCRPCTPVFTISAKISFFDRDAVREAL
jgi:hypothetical protein